MFHQNQVKVVASVAVTVAPVQCLQAIDVEEDIQMFQDYQMQGYQLPML